MILNKGIKSIILSLIIGTTSLVTGCSTNNNNNNDDDNNYLKVSAPTSIINKGRINSPWIDISVSIFTYRTLFEATSTNDYSEYRLDLAESYNISDDGLVYEILLKDNLIWSDGESISVEDVLFSLEGVLLSEESNILFTNYITAIDGADDFINGETDTLKGVSIDGNKIIITLEQPTFTFLKALSQLAILPKHALENEPISKIHESDFWYNPIVSGMYKVDEYIAEDSLTYIYNDKYVGEVPNIKSIVMRSDYTMNDIDYTVTNDIGDILDMRSIPNMEERHIESLYYRYIVFNILRDEQIDPVLGDIRVRNAIAYAINNDDLLTKIYYSNNNTYDGIVHSYNPEKSKELLAEAEYDFNRPLVLLNPYSYDETAVKLVDILASNFQEVGFKTEIINTTNIDSLYTEEYDYDIALKDLSAISLMDWYIEYDSEHMLQKDVFSGKNEFDNNIDYIETLTDLDERMIAFDELKMEVVKDVYKFPILTTKFKAYINQNRLIVPENIVFGNPHYKYYVDLANWSIKTD